MARRPLRIPHLPEQIIATPNALQECLAHLRSQTLLAYDTEFVGEHSYRPELCLVQVATRERLYLIDPYSCGPLEEFWQLLHDPLRTVIVHAGREEVRMCWYATGLTPANLFDVQIGAALIGKTYPIGYAGIVAELFSVQNHKSETLTDWRRRPLSAAQIKYAFDDVRYLIPAWEIMHERIMALQRMHWAEEEFRSFTSWAIGKNTTVERWRKLKGIGRLKRKELAQVRAIFGWREQLAERLNRPARYVLRDDLIVELAKRGARNQFDVSDVRGLPRGEAPTIQTTMQVAAELPLDECPQMEQSIPDPVQVNTLSALLGVVLGDLCARLELAPNFVASGQDLKDLVRAHLPKRSLPADSPFLTGWRAKHIRPELERILSGQLFVKVANVQLEAPLEYSQHNQPAEG